MMAQSRKQQNRRRFLQHSLAAGALSGSIFHAARGASRQPPKRGIRITRVKHYLVNVPERKWWWSDDVYGQPEHQRADHHIVEAETDQGLTGLTEVSYGVPVETVVSRLPEWVGRDVLEANLASPEAPFPGAFEQAVLDLRGQALGVPIWQLLGGRLRDRIPVAQTTGYKTPEHTAKQAQWGWERGFRAYKMKCITAAEDTPEKRIRYVTDRVEAIHKVLPNMMVRPDMRWRLREAWVCQELARRLQGHLIDSLESPIDQQAAAGTFSEWRRLRETISIPIADHIHIKDLVRAFQAGALDYAIVGAESHLEALRESALAHHLGMGGWSQTVAYGPGCAMGLHVAACMPNLSRPYDMVGPYAWIDTLLNEPLLVQDGSYPVPDRPGLGFTLNRDAVAKHLVKQHAFS